MGNKVSEAFKNLQKANPHASFASDSALSLVDEWEDTGCLSLNAILSGSLKGGVASGRVTGFVGESGTGKTYIMGKIAGNAQKKGKFITVYDSENAFDINMCKGVGLDPDTMMHVPIETVEETRNLIANSLTAAIEAGEIGQHLIIIDSLGNMTSEKEEADAKANKFATDMGTRAKALGSMLRMITNKAAKAKATVLFSNHVYDDPSQMHKATIKTQGGGKKTTYLPSTVVQLTISREEDHVEAKTEKPLPGTKRFKGIKLKMFTTKNRFYRFRPDLKSVLV